MLSLKNTKLFPYFQTGSMIFLKLSKLKKKKNQFLKVKVEIRGSCW